MQCGERFRARALWPVLWHLSSIVSSTLIGPPSLPVCATVASRGCRKSAAAFAISSRRRSSASGSRITRSMWSMGSSPAAASSRSRTMVALLREPFCLPPRLSPGFEPPPGMLPSRRPRRCRRKLAQPALDLSDLDQGSATDLLGLKAAGRDFPAQACQTDSGCRAGFAQGHRKLHGLARAEIRTWWRACRPL
jgi:hypothetical protein